MIKELDLSFEPQLELARDIFLFSFYTRGMSFIDMAHLKKSNLQNGILTYSRKKTGQRLTILWEELMQEMWINTRMTVPSTCCLSCGIVT